MRTTHRPPCQGLFSGLAESGRWFREALGDEQHVVLPHVSLALTPGATVLPLINGGAYDGALREFADAIPRLGRPMFLRIGYVPLAVELVRAGQRGSQSQCLNMS